MTWSIEGGREDPIRGPSRDPFGQPLEMRRSTAARPSRAELRSSRRCIGLERSTQQVREVAVMATIAR
jgi:hypothetical protein